MTLPDKQRAEIVTLRFDNAHQALDDAACMLERKSFRAAMNRCYYAAFYAASASALNDNRTFRKHSGLISYFHAEYIKPGLLDRKLGRILQVAFDNRSEADYQDVVRFTRDDVQAAIEQAEEFVRQIEAYVNTQTVTQSKLNDRQ